MRRALMALLLVATVTACNDGPGAASTYIHAQVDGKFWSAGPTSEGVVVYPGTSPDGAGVIYTIATRPISGGTEFVALNLPIPSVVGTYPMDGVTASADFGSCPKEFLADCIYWKPVAVHPGTLVITYADPSTGLIEGTFSYQGYLLGDSTKTTKNITQGQFSTLAPSAFGPT